MGRRTVAVTLAVLVMAACSGGGETPQRPPAPRVQPVSRELWEEAARTDVSALRYQDLPGVKGFGDLPEPARRLALALANLEICPCGCRDHTVAFCLNEDTDCLTAPVRAAELTALAAARVARLGAAAAPPAPAAGEPGPPPSEEATAGPQPTRAVPATSPAPQAPAGPAHAMVNPIPPPPSVPAAGDAQNEEKKKP